MWENVSYCGLRSDIHLLLLHYLVRIRLESWSLFGSYIMKGDKVGGLSLIKWLLTMVLSETGFPFCLSGAPEVRFSNWVWLACPHTPLPASLTPAFPPHFSAKIRSPGLWMERGFSVTSGKKAETAGSFLRARLAAHGRIKLMHYSERKICGLWVNFGGVGSSCSAF